MVRYYAGAGAVADTSILTSWSWVKMERRDNTLPMPFSCSTLRVAYWSVWRVSGGAGRWPAAAGAGAPLHARRDAQAEHLPAGAAHGPAPLRQALQPGLHHQAGQQFPLPQNGEHNLGAQWPGTIVVGESRCWLWWVTMPWLDHFKRFVDVKRFGWRKTFEWRGFDYGGVLDIGRGVDNGRRVDIGRWLMMEECWILEECWSWMRIGWSKSVD